MIIWRCYGKALAAGLITHWLSPEFHHSRVRLGGTVLADPARHIWIRGQPRYGWIEVRTMQESEVRTAEVKMFKEDPAAFGGEETHSRPYWADEEDRDEHPYWVLDYLEAGGWLQHLPEAEVGEPVPGITVHYNPEERNDILKVVLPDGTEIEADER